jgi:hypothetical protein
LAIAPIGYYKVNSSDLSKQGLKAAMSIKEQLLQTIEQAPEPLLQEALNYLNYLIEKHLDELEEQQDLEDLKLAREDLQNNRTISLEQLTQELGL